MNPYSAIGTRKRRTIREIGKILEDHNCRLYISPDYEMFCDLNSRIMYIDEIGLNAEALDSYPSWFIYQVYEGLSNAGNNITNFKIELP